MKCSAFTGEWICNECANDEFFHPDYDKAKALEKQAMLLGDPNSYEHMGLPENYHETVEREKTNVKIVKIDVR